ncbi:hypothetical protein WN48_10938 [Eufriesea mexicana]|uniref:Uncharacterized protein n=1 Tax=Eufriesea mexicana TaxID=516756 RepID=A0A310SCM4_9HYME|nr:hypothetical protein WN48_10938 [Eufriesea mexicana]
MKLLVSTRGPCWAVAGQDRHFASQPHGVELNHPCGLTVDGTSPSASMCPSPSRVRLRQRTAPSRSEDALIRGGHPGTRCMTRLTVTGNECRRRVVRMTYEACTYRVHESTLLQQRPEPAYIRVLQPRLPRGLQGHAEERPALLRELLENPVAVRLAGETPVNSRVEQAVTCDPPEKSVPTRSPNDCPTCQAGIRQGNGPRCQSSRGLLAGYRLTPSRVVERIRGSDRMIEDDNGECLRRNFWLKQLEELAVDMF